ncbi:hypothetical protein BH09SUM1_BH09SUM1_27680 [soil metagenome]
MAGNLKDVIRQVKEATDMVEFIGRTVTLKKAGNSYRGSCPFHKEKTPSFHVIPGKQIFHCFGCGVGGSIIDYVMKSERLEFIDALESLARPLNIEIPKSRPEDRAARDAEQQAAASVQTANAEALAWFRQNLLEGRNKLASDYLPERGLTEDLSEIFQLGAAPDAWEGLKQHLMRGGFSEGLLVDAGLCVRSESGRVYDRFRNRLIFPIFDVNGKVCGFGGRQLVKEENSPKYLNSAETVLYKKSNMLYALNLAKKEIEKSGYAILCEGYMDVIMAHAHGHPQAVASLGTALTPQQARLLKRFANRTYFLYDGDAAGQKAMLRGGEPLLEAGFDTRVISLPMEDDPDTFLRRDGKDALTKLIEGADEYIDYALRAHESGLNMTTLAGQAELVERMATIIAAIKNDVMREGAIQRLLRRLGGLPREAILRILRKKESAGGRRDEVTPGQRHPDAISGSQSGPVPDAPSRAMPRQDPLETSLLKIMLESAEALRFARIRLRHEWITDSRLEGWIFYLTDNEGYAQTLLDDAEASGEEPGPHDVIPAVLAMEIPTTARGEHTAQEILLRLHERHQQVLTHDLLALIDQKALAEEDAERLLKAFSNENRIRIQGAGKHLRTKDSHARRPRIRPGR